MSQASSRSTSELHIARLVLDQEMPARRVIRPSTKDYFFCYFPHTCTVTDDNGQTTHPAHTWICWNAEQDHSYGHDDQAWLHSCMHLSGSLVDELFKSLPMNKAGSVANPTALQLALSLLFECLQHQQDTQVASLKADNYSIILNCLRSIVQLALQTPRQDADREIAQLRRFLDTHFHQVIRLDQLAEKFHLSVSSLRSRFKASYDCSVIEYVIRCRMQHAHYLLSDSSCSINEIATRTGYHDLVHFSHVIKKRFGQSPRNLRKRLLAQHEILKRN